MTPKGHLTYRLQGIPISYTRGDIHSRLCHFLRLHGHEIQIFSLAQDPFSRSRQVATLALPSLPDRFRTPSKPDTWLLRNFWRNDQNANESTSPDATIDIDFYGLTPLHSSPDQDCDTEYACLYYTHVFTLIVLSLVAISGLNGHAFGSFKERGSDYMWLRDALPKTLPTVRVYIYGYDTRLIGSTSMQTIFDLGGKFGEVLKQLGLLSSRKLLLIGHSLGGLVVEMVSEPPTDYTKTNQTPLLTNGQTMLDLFGCSNQLLQSIRGAVFFGVPQLGLSSIEALREMVQGQPNEELIRDLNFDSRFLQGHRKEFHSMRKRMKSLNILSLYETEMTRDPQKDGGDWKMSGNFRLLVPRTCATFECDTCVAINRNHSEIVKFPPGDQDCHFILSHMQSQFLGAGSVAQLSDNQKNALQSLSFRDQHSRPESVEVEENTCQWLTEHKHFQHWLKKPSIDGERLLWVRGKPGSGKSTTMKYALQYLEAEVDHMIILSFFFHARGDTLQKTKLGFLRSILNQLLARLPEQLKDFTKKYEQRIQTQGPENFSWNEGYLQQLLTKYLREASKTKQIILLVDALDESGESTARELVSMFRIYVTSNPDATSSVRILYSCRHYPILNAAGDLIIEMECENAKDINTLVKRNLRQDIGDEQHVKELERYITGRAGGMFQWAILVTRIAASTYLRGSSMVEVLDEIKKLPRDLSELYHSLLCKKPPCSRTKRLFQWMIFSFRPLELDELRFAICLDRNMTERTIEEIKRGKLFLRNAETGIKDLSRGLLEVSNSGGRKIVQFIHQSVLDYLLQEGGLVRLFTPTPVNEIVGEAHFQISRSCIRYVLLQNFQEGNSLDRLSDKTPLFNYAQQFWSLHVMHAEHRKVPQIDLLDFLDTPLPQMTFEHPTLQAYWDNQKRFDSSWLLDDGEQVSNLRIDHPLFDLLAVGDTCCRRSRFKRAIEEAWEYAKEHSRLADILALIGIWSALRYLVYQRYGSLTLHRPRLDLAIIGNLQLDLETCWPRLSADDVNTNLATPYSPLWLAVCAGREDLLLQLINSGADLEHENGYSDEYKTTALTFAVLLGKVNLVRHLLDAGCRVNYMAFDHSYHLTPDESNEACRELMYEAAARRVVVDDTCSDRTALFTAIFYNDTSAVKLLVEAGVPVDILDDGETALFRLARYGQNGDMIRLLTSLGANPNYWCGQETPFTVALRSSSVEPARILLDCAILDVDQVDDHGFTPLMRLLRKSRRPTYRKMFALCIESQRFDLESQSPNGETILWMAVSRNQSDLVDILLTAGNADPNVQDIYGMTPLMESASRGYETVTRLLLACQEIDISIKDEEGWDAHVHAIEAGHMSLANLIVETIMD